MAGLSTPLRFRPGRFLEWWFEELSGLVPERIRRALRRGERILVLDFSARELVLREFRGDRCREVGRLLLERVGTAGWEGSAKALVRKVRLKNAELAVRLPADAGLRKTLDLPSTAESELREALFFQIDRQTPFAPEEVYFDYRVKRGQAEANRLMTELTVVPRERVDEAVETVARWGLQATIVDVATDDPNAPPRLNLLSETKHEKTTRNWSALNGLLALIALALAAAAVYIPLERQRGVVDDLSEKVAVAKSEAEEAAKLRQELEQVIEYGRFLAKQKQQAPSVLRVLDELTRIVPDDTWVYQLDIGRGEIRIAGYSSAASSLIGLISESPWFRRPQFRSPVTQDPRTGLERFNCSFELEKGGAEG